MKPHRLWKIGVYLVAIPTLMVLALSVVLVILAYGYPLIVPPPPPVVLERLDAPWEVLDGINAYRVSRSQPPLEENPRLCALAELRMEQIQTDWSHRGFDVYGPTMFASFCPSCTRIGENLAKEFFDEQRLVDAWIASSDHLPQLLLPYTHGCLRIHAEGGYAVLIVSYY